MNQIHIIMTQEITGWSREERKQLCEGYGIQRCYVFTNEITDDLPF